MRLINNHINFSCRHRLHRLVLFELLFNFLMIFLFIKYCTFDSFKNQTYLLSVVACLWLAFLKELVWLLLRVLNCPLVCLT